MYRIKQKFKDGYWRTWVQKKYLGIWWPITGEWVSNTKDGRISNARSFIANHKNKGPHYVP